MQGVAEAPASPVLTSCATATDDCLPCRSHGGSVSQFTMPSIQYFLHTWQWCAGGEFGLLALLAGTGGFQTQAVWQAHGRPIAGCGAWWQAHGRPMQAEAPTRPCLACYPCLRSAAATTTHSVHGVLGPSGWRLAKGPLLHVANGRYRHAYNLGAARPTNARTTWAPSSAHCHCC